MTQKKAIWQEIAAKELRGRDPADLTWNTLEGIAVDPIYTADDLHGLTHLEGLPGQEPFTRGVKATMYADALGQSANMRDVPQRKPPMHFIAKPWLRGSRAFPWRLIWPRIAAMTAITRAL